MYYFTIKNNTVYKNDSNINELFIINYNTGLIYIKRVNDHVSILTFKEVLNYDKNSIVNWKEVTNCNFKFYLCKNKIINYDYFIDGHYLYFIKGILNGVIREEKINQILNVLF